MLKDGELPRVVVNCRDDHVMHLGCLSQHRERLVTFMGGNGMYKCPACKESYSPTVKLYCNACRSRCINLPLSEASEQSGAIKTRDLRDEYG